METTAKVDVRKTLQPLEPLDLSKIKTVSDLVAAMSRCSFGARMLGEVAETLTSWINDEPRASEKPIIIYDGNSFSFLGALLERMVSLGWFQIMIQPDDFVYRSPIRDCRALIVGPISERYEEAINDKVREVIFVNPYGQAKPGLARDGYFKNVVFSDPRFIMPVLHTVLLERLGLVHLYDEVDFHGFINSLPRFGGLAAEVAQGATVLRKMTADPDCTVFLSLSGAMTVAKMGLLICDMIDRGMVHYIASTGALMAHGLVEGVGLQHYKYDPSHNDNLLADQKLNRVTDTLEPEENFDHIEEVVENVLDLFDGQRPISPSTFHRAIGQYLAVHFPDERGILKSAYLKNVPICVPAFVDSEIGNDIFVHNLKRKKKGLPPIVMDMEKDTDLLIRMVTEAKRVGIFSIGGGVPRNNTQNVAPLIEIINARGAGEFPLRQFFYGCRIDPTPLWYGNLSGCTYSEGGTWRKMDFNGSFSEIHADATIVWPFLLKYILETRSHQK